MSTNQQTADTNRTPMISLLAGSGLAWFGNAVTLIAVPWLVYQLTGSAGYTGLVGFAASLPLVLAGVFGGVLIDRIGHARTAVLAEVFSGLFLLAIPVLSWTVGLSIWSILVLVFVSNLFSAPGMTARRTLIPDVAERAGTPLERINSLDQMMARGAMLIGPPITGAAMAVFAPQNVILLAVATVWLSAIVVRIGVPAERRETGEPESPGSYLGDLLEGLRFVWQDRLIRALAIILATTNLLEAPLAVIAPIYADQILGGSVDLGLVFVALGVGLMLGVGAFAVWGERFPRRYTFIVGFLGIGGSYWILATTPGLLGTMSVLFVLGLLAGPINPMLSTVYQERVPVAMRGRVFGLLAATALSMLPAGRLAGGMLIEWVGLGGTLLIQAIGFALCSVLVLTAPALRLLDERSTPESTAHRVAAQPSADTGTR
jgi:MFS family permease